MAYLHRAEQIAPGARTCLPGAGQSEGIATTAPGAPCRFHGDQRQRYWSRPHEAEQEAGIPSTVDLIVAYQTTGCPQCIEQLLESHAKLLHHVLRHFAYSGEPYEDLLQVARLGFVKAVRRFDAGRGHAFSTYTVVTVEGEVRHYLRDCLLIRHPRWARGLADPGEEMMTAGIATAAQESARDIGAPDDHITLYESLTSLSESERELIYLLFFRDLTQQQAAEELGMSQRAVSRKEQKVLRKLRAALRPEPL